MEEKKVEEIVSLTYLDYEVTDPDFVKYFRQENLFDALENGLLGSYDDKGVYSFPSEILKVLVSVAKLVEKKEGHLTYLKAPCGKVTLKFVLETGLIDLENAYATLKLIENKIETPFVKAGEIITPVAYYKDDNDSYFQYKINKIFNIITEEDEGRIKENEQLANLILTKLSKDKTLYDYFLSESRLRDKVYVENVLKILEKDEKFGSYILRKYNAYLSDFAHLLNPEKKNYYRILKQIIDRVLLEEQKNMPEDIEQSLKRLRKVYVQANEKTVDYIVKGPQPKKQVKEQAVKLKGTGLPSFKYSASKPSKKSESKKYSSPFFDDEDGKNKKIETKKPIEIKQTATSLLVNLLLQTSKESIKPALENTKTLFNGKGNVEKLPQEKAQTKTPEKTMDEGPSMEA